MNFTIVSPDKGGTVEGAINSNILSYLPRGDDVAVVPISRFGHFQFNEELYKIRKPVVIVDFVEYGANDWDRKNTHIWGTNTLDNFGTFKDWGIKIDEWRKFDKWVADCPPALIFKRELLAKDVSPTLQPIDYGCYVGPIPADSRDAFNGRPLEVFYSWGHSHEGRRRVHGEIFKQSSHLGYDLISAWDQFDPHFKHLDPNNKSRVWAAIYSPFFTRIDIKKVLLCQGRSKLSLSMPGAGIKCFRHAEAPVNAVMVKQSDDLAWSFPWVHGVNSIVVEKDQTDFDIIRGLKGDEEVPAMNEALKRDDLYDIYVRGLETVDKYRGARYAREYLIPKIEEAIS